MKVERIQLNRSAAYESAYDMDYQASHELILEIVDSEVFWYVA
jgi:hypothetical protein